MAATCFSRYDDVLEMVRYGLFILLGATGLSVLLSAHKEETEDTVQAETVSAEKEGPHEDIEKVTTSKPSRKISEETKPKHTFILALVSRSVRK